MSDHAISNGQGWLETIKELVTRLESARQGRDQDAEDAARQEIEEGPLSVMVRDGWRQPAALHNDEGPEEFEILLSTGGPALRIYGKLDQYGQPDDDPQLQWQDWGTPWTNISLETDDREAVATYARQFYFSE